MKGKFNNRGHSQKINNANLDMSAMNVNNEMYSHKKYNMNTESFHYFQNKQSKLLNEDANIPQETKQNFIEQYFFYPKLWHKLLSFTLLPISFLYYCIALLRKRFSTTKDFGIKIISIGNLVSGGSGKTPFCIALVKHLESLGYHNIFIILRGYKRHSKGLQEVSLHANILCSVKQSGDEAMLIAQSTQSSVIVCENREKAICHALNNKAQIIILDDAYRFNFKKFDILLEPIILPYFDFVLPSGYYRFPPSFYKQCNLHLKEGRDYKRYVQIICKDSLNKYALSTSLDSKEQTRVQDKGICFVLATAIANPIRLTTYLPNNIVAKYYLPDHAEFDEKELKHLLEKYNATHILMTQKDYVKCQNFELPIAVLTLDIQIQDSILTKIHEYLQ